MQTILLYNLLRSEVVVEVSNIDWDKKCIDSVWDYSNRLSRSVSSVCSAKYRCDEVEI